ncbi:hypothetical protein PENTCL1PPCAC_14352, partial [Pristionchus entomophagus]
LVRRLTNVSGNRPAHIHEVRAQPADKILGNLIENDLYNEADVIKALKFGSVHDERRNVEVKPAIVHDCVNRASQIQVRFANKNSEEAQGNCRKEQILCENGIRFCFHSKRFIIAIESA